MEKSLKMNAKTKVFCTGKRIVAMGASKFPYSVCRKGAGRNSIFYASNVTVGCIKDALNKKVINQGSRFCVQEMFWFY